MNSLIFPALVAVVACFHLAMKTPMRKGRLKTGFCAIWCVDAIFSVCGTVISFMLYRYLFLPFLTVRNVVLVILYLLITLLFVWMAPSGFSLITKKRSCDEETVLRAEYRLNETLGMVRNCFLILLFALPALFAIMQMWDGVAFLEVWKESEICGGFCFVAFLFLVPVTLRQAIFWLRNLADGTKEAKAIEEGILEQHRMQLRYRHKNTCI